VRDATIPGRDLRLTVATRRARRRGWEHECVSTAQNSDETAVRPVGRPFPKGVSGNPGGRPQGLARYVRELVGDDGRRIADFMLGVLDDGTERKRHASRVSFVVPPRQPGQSGTKVAEFGLVMGKPQVSAPALEGGTSAAGVLLKRRLVRGRRQVAGGSRERVTWLTPWGMRVFRRGGSRGRAAARRLGWTCVPGRRVARRAVPRSS
jgi:hypothetical protein